MFFASLCLHILFLFKVFFELFVKEGGGAVTFITIRLSSLLGYNARKVNQLRIHFVHIETSSLSADFVNNSRYISVRLVSEEDKSIEF